MKVKRSWGKLLAVFFVAMLIFAAAYSLSASAATDYLMFGDCDLDGVIEPIDVTACNSFAQGKVSESSDSQQLAFRFDMDADGDVDADDVAIVEKRRTGEMSEEDVPAYQILYRNPSLFMATECNKTTYAYGEPLDTTGVWALMYMDDYAQYRLYEDCLTVSGYDPYQIGEQELTVSYYQYEASLPDGFTVTVMPPTYTVTYNANGGTGGPTTQTKYEDTDLTITSSQPSRTGYTFLGWSTEPDDVVFFEEDAIEYKPGDTYWSNENITLYAVWREDPTWISKDSTNSAIISKAGCMKYFYYTPTQSGTYAIYSTGSADTVLELFGSDYTHYDTVDRGGKLDNFRAEYDLEANVKYIFGIRYYGERTTGTIPFTFSRMYTVTYSTARGDLYETSKSIFWNDPIGDLPELYEDGYNFLGWSFTGTNSSSYVSSTDTYTYSQDKTIYANWERITYTVSYNANGGTGGPTTQTKYCGTDLILTSTEPTRTGYTFLGWHTDQNVFEEVEYTSGSTYKEDEDLVLYAVWRKNPVVMSSNTAYNAAISKGGEQIYFSFTPTASGSYVIYSTGADDTHVYLYDTNYTKIEENDDGGLELNFRLEKQLTA